MGADTARSPQSTPARDSAWLLKAAHRMGLEGMVPNSHALPNRIESNRIKGKCPGGAARRRDGTSALLMARRREGRPKGCVVAEEPFVCNVAAQD